jgi:hypothetical protein
VPQYQIAEFVKLRGKFRQNLDFKQGQMCKYKLMFPTDAGEFDQITLLISEATRVDIYASETETFGDPDTQALQIATGDSLDITFPNSLYLTIVSHEVQSPGDYVISYRFNDRDPDEVIAAMTEEERQQYYDKKPEVVLQQREFWKEWEFWALVVVGIVGVAIMIMLCCCLLNMKRKNDQIIAKVTKLEENDGTQNLQKEDEGPVAPSKPFTGDEDDTAGAPIKSSSTPASPPKTKMLMASKAAVNSPSKPGAMIKPSDYNTAASGGQKPSYAPEAKK